VCLWERFSAVDTIMEAVCRLQQIISWKLFNIEPDHVIHPAASQWYSDPDRIEELPLEFTPVVELEQFKVMKGSRKMAPHQRRRLEPFPP